MMLMREIMGTLHSGYIIFDPSEFWGTSVSPVMPVLVSPEAPPEQRSLRMFFKARWSVLTA